MKLPLAILVALLSSACGTTGITDAGIGGGTGGSGGGTGGATQDSGTPCNTVPDDGATFMPGCPGYPVCAQCNLLAGDGGVVLDGTYSLASETLWESACGIISMDASHATLIISNGTMELVSTGPLALSMDTPTVRVSMTYVVNGNQLDVTQTCPPDTGASGPVSFTVSGDTLSLSRLPGLIAVPVFLKRP